MDRIKEYFSRYIELDDDVMKHLADHGTIRKLTKGTYYVDIYEKKKNWCFLLEGVIAYQITNNQGKMLIERLAVSYQYFSGTKHAFSQSSEEVAIYCITDCTIYEIQNKDLQEAIRKFPPLSQMYHILKQHYLDQIKLFLRIQKMDRPERLLYLYRHLPELRNKLTIDQVCSVLGYTDDRQYYKALTHYLSSGD